MAHIRASHLIVSPDDIEDATMSLHLSTKTPGQSGRGSVSEGGCIDSLGRFHPPGSKPSWNITWPMAFAAFCASLANLARGFVLGYSSPSIPELQAKGLLLDDDETSWYASLTPIGSLAGALLGGVVTHQFGRKLSTMFTCLPLAFGWLSIVAADSTGWLYLGRVLTGVGNGMSSLVTSVYVSEVASSNARGMLGTVNQIATSLGVLVVYALPFLLDYKWLAVFGGANAALTMILMTFMPETPRWLVTKARTQEAVENFMWLRRCDKETAQLVIRTLEEEMIKQQTSFNIRELFSKAILKPFFVSQLSMVFQQFTGLFVLLFYTQSIFQMVGFSDGRAATALMGAVTVIAYAFTPLLVERTGRRIMLNISAVGVMVSASVLGVCFYIHDQKAAIDPTPEIPATMPIYNLTTPFHIFSTPMTPANITGASNLTTTTITPWTTASPVAPTVPTHSAAFSYVALISAVSYMASYSLGYGPLPWVLLSELIPLRARATVGGIAVFLTWLLTFFVTKIFAPLSAIIGVAGCFWIFAGFSALSLLYVGFLLPETKGRTLEEIEYYFVAGRFPDHNDLQRRKVRVRVCRTPRSTSPATPSDISPASSSPSPPPPDDLPCLLEEPEDVEKAPIV